MLIPTQQYSQGGLAGITQGSVKVGATYQNQHKIKILAWGDSATAGTGFGVVSKNVLMALHNTGNYEIHQLAINHHGDFVDQNIIPWQMQPARLLDPNDPHGMKMFCRTLAKSDYDIVWVQNDIYVTQEVVKQTQQVLQEKSAMKRKIPKIVYYYPVDCKVLPTAVDFLKISDVNVTYTDYAIAETLKTLDIKDKLVKIPLGVNISNFRKISVQDKIKFKKQFLQADPDTFIVLNVNRNSTRKQLPYSIAAFKEFKKQVPNSKMYIHTAVHDQGGDLLAAIRDLGLSTKDDVVFPLNYSPANPVPEETMNLIYNCADLFLTTHLGEGWGLTQTEAMAAGVPVVAPNNTCVPELLGLNEERGFIYPCADTCWIDNSGFRPKGVLPDIVGKMMEVYNNKELVEKKTLAAREWVENYSWKHIGDQWVHLIAKALNLKPRVNTKIVSGEMI